MTYTTVRDLIERKHADLSGFQAVDAATLRSLPAGTPILRYYEARSTWQTYSLVKVNRTTATVQCPDDGGALAGAVVRIPLADIKGAKS